MTVYIWVHIRYNSIMRNRKYAKKGSKMKDYTVTIFGEDKEETFMVGAECMSEAKEKALQITIITDIKYIEVY